MTVKSGVVRVGDKLKIGTRFDGIRANIEGVERHLNPHPWDSRENIVWDNGWLDSYLSRRGEGGEEEPFHIGYTAFRNAYFGCEFCSGSIARREWNKGMAFAKKLAASQGVEVGLNRRRPKL